MDAERVRRQLDQILASAEFADAERATSFLRFVVNRVLDRRAGEIKESVIAVEALGRSPSFDPKSDPIVRVEARRLRDRLDSYYRREGADDPVVISLPKGGYVPEFSDRQPIEPPPSTKLSSAMLRAGWALFAVAALALAWIYFHEAPESRSAFRLSILPPANTTFESFAISPDGKAIAFTAIGKGGPMLWVRALDSLEAKPLAGTEDASQPFWSPDSRSIGFFTNSKLKTIGTAGGPARDIADIVVGRGASWGRDGMIVFGPIPDGVLYQVPANGGTARAVTSLDPSRAEIAHALPQFLPDGRRFLYLASSVKPGMSAIRVASLDGNTAKVLLASDAGATYVPASGARPASLVFVSRGAIMCQPFDLAKLTLAGERTAVAPEVRYRRWRDPGFSASANGILLYMSGSAEDRRFTWFDRQGKPLETVGPRNSFAAFNLSPDGRYLSLWSDNDPATSSPTVWLMDLWRDGTLSRFSELGVSGPEFLPVWSLEGRELLFSRGDERHMRLLRRSVNGGTVQIILDSDGPKFPSDWSSDRRFLLFSSQWPDYHDMHVWKMQLDATSAPRPLAQHPYAELGAVFSPADGAKGPRWIAYTSAETGRYEVYVQAFPDGGRRWTASTRGGWLPHWSHDGRELFYVALDGTLMSVALHADGGLQSGAPRPLFATDLRPTAIQTLMNEYAISQDGRRFLLNAPLPEGVPISLTAVAGW